MLSLFEPNYELDSAMTGYVVDETHHLPNHTEYIKVLIPSLMPSTTTAKHAATHVAKASHTSVVFLNAPECRPQVKPIIHGQNYLPGKLSYQSEWHPSQKDTYLNEYGNISHENLHNRVKVKCELPGNKLSKLHVDTDWY